MNRDTPIIITGMHRSGTSLVARFIHHSGIDLGDRFVGVKPSNPYGHYEDVEILEFQQGILLRQFGHSMWVPVLPPVTDADWSKAEDLVRIRREKSHWGWKEPRTSLFLYLWSELLPDAFYLFIVRHPLLVLDSLRRRTHTRFYHIGKHNTFLEAWLLYNQACFDFYLSHRPSSLLVTLEGALQQMERLALLLSQQMSISFDADEFGSLYDPTVLAREKKKQLLVSPMLYTKCLSFYQQLSESADLGSDRDDDRA
ncbi:MAG: hypothetical protein ACP5JJ_09505 [Anaerolineae bacterium]